MRLIKEINLRLFAFTTVHKAEHHQNKRHNNCCKNSYHHYTVAPIYHGYYCFHNHYFIIVHSNAMSFQAQNFQDKTSWDDSCIL